MNNKDHLVEQGIALTTLSVPATRTYNVQSVPSIVSSSQRYITKYPTWATTSQLRYLSYHYLVSFTNPLAFKWGGEPVYYYPTLPSYVSYHYPASTTTTQPQFPTWQLQYLSYHFPTLPPYLSKENLPPAAGEEGREGQQFLIIEMMIDDWWW